MHKANRLRVHPPGLGTKLVVRRTTRVLAVSAEMFDTLARRQRGYCSRAAAHDGATSWSS